MTYFTASKSGNIFLLDCFSDNYETLKRKFPNETIYKSDKLLKSIYLTKDQLVKAHG